MPPKSQKRKELPFKVKKSNVNARTNEIVDEADDETSFVFESGAAEVSFTKSKTSGIEIPIKGQPESQQEPTLPEARLLPSAQQHEEKVEEEEASAVNEVKATVRARPKKKIDKSMMKNEVSPLISYQKEDSQPEKDLVNFRICTLYPLFEKCDAHHIPCFLD